MKITPEILKKINTYAPVSTGVNLSGFTTFKTGGPAEVLVEPSDEVSLTGILNIIRSQGVPITVIGGGSNLLISDRGIEGIVLKISETTATPLLSEKYIYASSFVLKDKFIEWAVNSGYGGLEFMAGIPGTIGGGIFMNAGTFMGSFSDILVRIRISDSAGRVYEIDTDQDTSQYRKMNIPEGSVILGGYFSLPIVQDAAPVLKCMRETIDERWVKHPMEYPSAGSVFKNPPGNSSWKLIDDCGLKGFTIGGAMVSEKHTNFIINKGNALSSDIYELINFIRERVFENTGVRLETEIKIMGDFS